MVVIMAQHITALADAAQSYSDAEEDKRYISVFKRRRPLAFSPNRQYVLAVVAPLQKQDSCETVLADDRSSGAASPAHADNRREILYNSDNWISSTRPRFDSFDNWLSSTSFEPFSFDERDAARKVERERRLQMMRQMQELQWVRMLSSEDCHSEDAVNQRFSTLALKIHFPAELSSNLDQTHLHVTF